MIRCRDLSVTFRGPAGHPVHALSDVTLTVAPGEFVAVFGPSGSGKSTLLLTLAGLIKPSAGSVHLDGRSVYELSAGERARLRHETVGFVFQLFHLVPYLTAMENVCVPLVLTRVPARRQHELARQMLVRVGLETRLDHRPGQLSVGQRQRVALARALVTDPKLILADEPTGNLDDKSAHEILAYLQEFHKAGKTIVLVTHDSEAAKLADRRVTLSAGKLRENG